jgi:benzoate-CoA ligase family protein
VASDAGDTSFVTVAGDFDAAVVTRSAVAAGEEPMAAAATDAGDPAVWLFSGGTTGVPKAVVQTHGSFVNTTRRYAHDTLGYGPDDVTLSVPKLYFGYATGSNLLFPFSVGGSAVLFPEHPTADLLFDLIDRYRPTIFITVPTMVAKMVGDGGAHDLSCLRFATSAGEALPHELYRSWKETFGVELLDGLGTAEMWHVFITNRPGAVKLGTVGQPVEGFELQVCDPEGNPVPAGEVGQMWVKGDSLAKGYWDDPDQTAAAFRGPWFVGGDLIRIDQEGYVEHHGRADDRLKVGGKWLAPQEVESCLLEHEAVDTAVVVGVPDEAGLIKPVAYVIPTDEWAGLEDELITWTLDRLEPYKHPRRVFVVKSLPTTHLGKVDRTKLKEMAARA